MRTVVPHGPHVHLVPKEAKLVFKGIIYDVYHWQQTRFDGSVATFEMLKRPDTVKVIAIRGGKIVAIVDEQPSYPAKLTLPGGRHDIKTETELDCAKREILEETGLIFKSWKLIQATQQHEKIEQIVYIFLATDFVNEVAPHVDPGGEKIQIRLMTFEEAKKIAEAGADKYWPNDILRQVDSLEELLALPEYS